MSPPSPSLFLLDSLVHTGQGIQGRLLSSGEKLAFGFAENHYANPVLQDLVLEAKLAGAPDLSSLILRGSCRYTSINNVDKDLIVMRSAFPRVNHRPVFLIYDASDRSLHMIPSMPPSYRPVRTGRVLIARSHDDDPAYTLVFPGQEFVSSDEVNAQYQDVLFLSESSSTSPWQKAKKFKFPDHLRSEKSNFFAEEVFSSHGRGYWVDLLWGGMCCDCSDILSDDIDPVVFRSFDLPVGCQKYLGIREDIAEARAFRAMGPVGDSIKFVSIDGYLELIDFKDCKVRIWTLMEDMNWAVEYELSLMSLWEGVEFKGDLLPRQLAPMYPFLSREEDHVVYFALGNYTRGEKNCFPTDPRCMLRVDLHSQTFNCTELHHWRGTSMASLLALSGNVEDKLLGLPAKRKLPTISG
ncbi:unnamed protein product [Alopecurus aequalis]